MRSLTRTAPTGEGEVLRGLIERSRLAISESVRLRHQLSDTRHNKPNRRITDHVACDFHDYSERQCVPRPPAGLDSAALDLSIAASDAMTARRSLAIARARVAASLLERTAALNSARIVSRSLSTASSRWKTKIESGRWFMAATPSGAKNSDGCVESE